ncbi:OmpH family outer membrane protein [Rhodovibrionaceae bacterium A322]
MKTPIRRFGKVLSAALFAGALLAVSPVVTGQALAQEKLSSPVILVIDMQAALRGSTAAQGIQKELDTKSKAIQSELKSQEEGLRKSEQELLRQQTILSSEAFGKKKKELEEKIVSFQQGVVTRRKDLERRFAKGMSQVERKLIQLVDKVAVDKGANLVLPKSAVVLVHNSLDVTKDVLELLNKEMPKVALPEK